MTTKKIIRYFLWSCLMLLLLAFFSGCATSPNIPFAGIPIPSTLAELNQRNPLLVQEIGKLPEIQDGISQLEEAALDRIIYLYDSNPERFNEVFKEMYQVGLPDVRKYCSPLQALFWLAEDGVLNSEIDLIKHYSLEELLSKAWNFGPPGNLKWKDFATVQERLNAPELGNYYEKARFFYVDYKTIPGYDSGRGDPYWVFANNKGDCVYTTSFTVSCLARGGYNAWEMRVHSYNPAHAFHAICVFYWHGKKYVMDNGTPFQAGIMSWEEYKEEHSGRF